MQRIKKCVMQAALTLLVLQLLGCRSGPQYTGFAPEEQPRSVIIGELLAIFPGLLWHGLGHRYAGDHKKAEEIELMEAYSLLALGAGTGMVFAGRSDDDLRFVEYSGYTVGGMGGLLFLGSWLYDVIYTPEAIDRYNASLERR